DQVAAGEVAGGAEDDVGAALGGRFGAEPGPERIGNFVVLGDVGHLRQLFFTAWPPNSLRRAACTFALNDSSCREAMRISRLKVITGAGTFWSMAVCTVQRPSPLSST